MMILFLSLMTISVQASGDDWLCKHIASEKRGNSIYTCGVAQAPTEQLGMENALYAAQNEFSHVCSMSADCKGHKMDIEAKRSECEDIPQIKDAWIPGSNYYKFKCYRLVVFSIKG